MIFQLVLLVAAVTWIAPRVASGASVALPIPDPRTCVPRTSAAKYGWITPIGSFQGTSGQATILQPLAPSVTLEVGTWESSLITNTVAGILLRDIFGAAVTLQQFNSSAGSITRIGRGSIDMNFEAWPSSFGSDYALLVIQSGLVEDLGATGYSGKQAWFINQAITAANPTVIFDSWMSFKVPAVIARLPRVGTTAPSRRIDGSTLCDSQFSFCSRGTFVPPQCAGSLAQSCGEFWSLDPLLSNGANEQRIVDLGLKLVVVYLTEPDLYANAERCAAQPTSLCLFAHQSPSAISDSLSVSPVNLPDYVPRCWNQFSSAQVPASHLSCDSPMEVLTKLSTVGIANRAPHLRSFARYFTLRDIDIQSLTSATLASADTWAIACQWISQYPTIWESWVGAPPIGYFRVLDQIVPGEPFFVAAVIANGLIAVALLASFVALLRKKRTAVLKRWLPKAFASVMVSASAAVLITASSTPTSYCSIQFWLATLGLATVEAMLLADAWSTFYRPWKSPDDSKLVLVFAVHVFLAAGVAATTQATGGFAPVNWLTSVTQFSISCQANVVSGTISTIWWASQVGVAVLIGVLRFKSGAATTGLLWSLVCPTALVVGVLVMPLHGVSLRMQFLAETILLPLGVASAFVEETIACWHALSTAAANGALSESKGPMVPPPTHLVARIGNGYKVQEMSGLIRTWVHAHLLLFHQPCPMLVLIWKGMAHSYHDQVGAAVIDSKLLSKEHFLIQAKGTSFLVRAKDSADADLWIHDIESTFRDGDSTATSQSAANNTNT